MCKPFERQEIVNTKLSEESVVPFNVFKDPQLFDLLRIILNIPLQTRTLNQAVYSSAIGFGGWLGFVSSNGFGFFASLEQGLFFLKSFNPFGQFTGYQFLKYLTFTHSFK